MGNVMRQIHTCADLDYLIKDTNLKQNKQNGASEIYNKKGIKGENDIMKN